MNLLSKLLVVMPTNKPDIFRFVDLITLDKPQVCKDNFYNIAMSHNQKGNLSKEKIDSLPNRSLPVCTLMPSNN